MRPFIGGGIFVPMKSESEKLIGENSYYAIDTGSKLELSRMFG